MKCKMVETVIRCMRTPSPNSRPESFIDGRSTKKHHCESEGDEVTDADACDSPWESAHLSHGGLIQLFVLTVKHSTPILNPSSSFLMQDGPDLDFQVHLGDRLALQPVADEPSTSQHDMEPVEGTGAGLCPSRVGISHTEQLQVNFFSPTRIGSHSATSPPTKFRSGACQGSLRIRSTSASFASVTTLQHAMRYPRTNLTFAPSAPHTTMLHPFSASLQRSS